MPEAREEQDAQSADGQGRRPLDGVAAYRLAKAISDAGWDDAVILKAHPFLAEVAPQLIRALGSITANVSEGYARKSSRDRTRYYEYALGSVEESLSWYHVARRALTSAVLGQRTATLTSIRRLLLTMIRNERRSTNWNTRRP